MGKRPWQIWLVFGVSLLLAIAAMTWLTGQVMRLDEAEATAQARMEQDERIGAALWRMDGALSQLLATEAGRPVGAYRPVLVAAKGKAATETSQSVSPLLLQSSEFVLLHFEVDANDCWASPQCPDEQQLSLALSNGASVGSVSRSRERLMELSDSVRPDVLLERIPDNLVVQDFANVATNFAFTPPQVIVNTVNLGVLQEQLQVQQTDQQEQMEQYDQEPTPRRQARAQQQANDFNQRFNSLQTAAQQALLNQHAYGANEPNPDMLLESGGPVSLTQTQPIWMEERLLLVRQVNVGAHAFVQGCWLDWPAIKRSLLKQVDDLLPNADLRPVASSDSPPINRMLASLPVEVLPPPLEVFRNGMSPMQAALLVAWGCLAAVTIAVAGLLHGVMRLSERRASFVSAVTHELRTPLTTFRMYSEMLVEGMVAPEKQDDYLRTLRSEADRLSHLVDNVLHYAKLEKSKAGWELSRCHVVNLLPAISERLESRAEQCGLRIEWVEAEEVADLEVETNPGALEQILFNLVDNACKYGRPHAAPRMELEVSSRGAWVAISLRDFGPGVAPDVRRRMFQPFSRNEEVGPAPGVGLGLALCRRLARQLKGKLDYEPASPGARFTLLLPKAGPSKNS
ncbi:MAG: HAMP domain-containing histidine kinase [Planctomycetales bacterium]|nr:HAMP domain-containing histidine kinase [Planctomycetales bacterium]